jgi:hypothetical protein
MKIFNVRSYAGILEPNKDHAYAFGITFLKWLTGKSLYSFQH